MIKVLIVSSEVWRDESNGGNVLSSIFSNNKYSIAQIYCNAGIPKNKCCNKYLQITETSSLKSIFKKVDPFAFFNDKNLKNNKIKSEDNLKKRFSKFKLPLFIFLRELLFLFSKWKQSKSLKKFIEDFSPDIVFAPCYGSLFMQTLNKYISKTFKIPTISYISDDNYSLKQFSLSIFFWINRILTRKLIRYNLNHCRLVYTMTEQQKDECSIFVSTPIKLLRKDYINTLCVNNFANKHTFIYAGGVYLNRYKNLILIQKQIKTFDKNAHIDIYTNEKNPKILSKLKKVGCYIYSAISYSELLKKYKEYEFSIHTESFDLCNRLRTRLSFSTKIVDCLASGTVLLAYGPKNNAGIQTIFNNNIALCCFNKKDLISTLSNIFSNKVNCFDIVSKANIFCKDNFSCNSISFYNDIKGVLQNEKDFNNNI